MKQKTLYDKILDAYIKNKPLKLLPGDVMMIRHLLREVEVFNNERLELLSGFGGHTLEFEGKRIIVRD